MQTCLHRLLAIALLLAPLPVVAQPVRKTTIAEHFTNTFCSVCASRNPGLFGNLSAFPDVLHVSYYPSAPYASCPFNQMNKVEQDARTNFYGVYGSTPRLVVNGTEITNGTPFTDPTIFVAASGETSNFSMGVQVRRLSDVTAEATITIKKVAPDTLSSLQLYAVVAEDTVLFAANNGETIHYNKFNKSLGGSAPLSISSPSAVGDSVSRTFTFPASTGWTRSRVTAILQDGSKRGLQAARSAPLPSSTNVPYQCPTALCIYPVPARNEIRITGLPAGYHNFKIRSLTGQVLQTGIVYDGATPLSLHNLQSGVYSITVEDAGQLRRGTFLKQ